MGSLFVNPGLLGLAALVSVPIIIYLINRHRYRRRKWAAMTFLLKALRKSQRRLQIQNLLLLIIRCLIVLFLVLAIARPVLDKSPLLNPEGGQNWILVIDQSYSMDYRDAPLRGCSRPRETWGERARDSTHDSDRVAATTMGHSPGLPLLSPRAMTPQARKDLETALEQLTIDHRTVRLVTSLRAIDDLANEFRSPTGEREPCNIVLFTDLQRKDWLGETGPRSPEIRQILDGFQKDSIDLVFAQLSSDDDKLNIAVTELSVHPELIAKDVPVEIRVTVRNFSDRDAENLDLSLRVDPDIGAEKTEAQLGEVIRVPAGGFVTRSLPLRFDEAGYHTVVAEVRSDGLVVDNERFLVVRVHEKIEVLLVDGDPAVDPLARETFFLGVALQPRDDALGAGAVTGRVTPFEPVERSDDLLADVDWKRYSVVVLANVSDIGATELRTLERYVREGGAVIAYLGSNVRPDVYNSLFHKDGAGLLPFPLIEKTGDSRVPVYLEFSDPNHPIARYFGEHKEMLELERSLIPFYHYFRADDGSKDSSPEVEEGEPTAATKKSTARIVARFGDQADADSDGSPAVFDNGFGRGRVLWFTSTADDDWNEFPAWQDYVVFLHESISYLVGFRRRTDNVGIGEEFQRFYESDQLALHVVLHAPPLPGASLGSTRTIGVPMKPLEDDNRLEIVYDSTTVPGLYGLDFDRAGGRPPPAEDDDPGGTRVATGLGSTVEYFAVNVSTDESDLKMITAEEFTSSFGMTPEVFDFSARLRNLEEQKKKLRGQEFWPWCLAIAILLLFAETALAQYFGRRAN